MPSDLSLMNGALFDVYRNSFMLTHPDALEQKKSMHLSLRSNTLVKYRDANRRIIQVVSKLPQATYPNVSATTPIIMQTLQANEAIDPKQEVFYFEIKILNSSTRW